MRQFFSGGCILGKLVEILQVLSSILHTSLLIDVEQGTIQQHRLSKHCSPANYTAARIPLQTLPAPSLHGQK